MVSVIILFFIVVIASALCSLSEAAILSLPLVRARILHEQNRRNSRDLLYIKENIADTIASIVIANNTINIVGSIFVGQLVVLRFGDHWLGLASTVMTFAIIVAGEVIPKTIGERYKVGMSLFFAKPLRLLVVILRPLVILIIKMIKSFVPEGPTLPRVTEDEIRMMLKLGQVEGTVEVNEEVLCNRVFKLNDVRAAQIMKPIDQIYALPAYQSLGEIKEAIMGFPYSRIVVYDKDPLDIVGTVQHRVLLREIAQNNDQARVKDFAAKPIFVNWFTKANALLEKFQAYHQHLFIVQDSQGKNVGLVTMEDVLEELFGEIYDEKDVVKSKNPDGTESDGI